MQVKVDKYEETASIDIQIVGRFERKKYNVLSKQYLVLSLRQK